MNIAKRFYDSASEVASLLKIMQGGGAPDAKPVDMDMINPTASKLKKLLLTLNRPRI